MTPRFVGWAAAALLLGAGSAGAIEGHSNTEGTSTNDWTVYRAGSSNTSDLSVTGWATGGASNGSGPDLGLNGKVKEDGDDAQGGPAQEVSGKVVKQEGKTVFVQQGDTTVPLQLTGDTKLGGPGVQAANAIRQGQEVRASYRVVEKDNVALSLQGVGPG